MEKLWLYQLLVGFKFSFIRGFYPPRNVPKTGNILNNSNLFGRIKKATLNKLEQCKKNVDTRIMSLQTVCHYGNYITMSTYQYGHQKYVSDFNYVLVFTVSFEQVSTMVQVTFQLTLIQSFVLKQSQFMCNVQQVHQQSLLNKIVICNFS